MTETPVTKDKRRGSLLTESNVSSPRSEPPQGILSGSKFTAGRNRSCRQSFTSEVREAFKARGATAQPPA